VPVEEKKLVEQAVHTRVSARQRTKTRIGRKRRRKIESGLIQSGSCMEKNWKRWRKVVRN